MSRTSLNQDADWYNPGDWLDENPRYNFSASSHNYYTDEFYNERTGQVGFHDYRSGAWNYPGSAWDDQDNWDDDWNDDWAMDNWSGDFDWSDPEWWE